jgi:dTDP-glucose pyrophosphorylase
MVKKMAKWKNLMVGHQTSILKSIEILDQVGLQIILVVDHDHRLLGTVTDGDVRRAILRGISLQNPVSEIMNQNPALAGPDTLPDEILSLLQTRDLKQIPIVDEERRVTGVSTLADFLSQKHCSNSVVIMAGGMGKRLYPLTKDTPKPMLKIGTKPILETILENFTAQGFRNFYFSVNYKAERVKEYFGEGSRFGANIQYIHEQTHLGTAGSLALLEIKQNLPLIVMNGDLLTKINFAQLLSFHEQQGVEATLCIREYEFQVPYGVVSLDQLSNQVLGINEKPTHKFFINGGIYVLNPTALDLIPSQKHYDMPNLFSDLIRSKRLTGAFPVREYWMDIGKLDDFDRANHESMGTL